VTLPRQTGNEDDFFHETMGLRREESSFDHNTIRTAVAATASVIIARF
jgi:hypothetical protein